MIIMAPVVLDWALVAAQLDTTAAALTPLLRLWKWRQKTWKAWCYGAPASSSILYVAALSCQVVCVILVAMWLSVLNVLQSIMPLLLQSTAWLVSAPQALACGPRSSLLRPSVCCILK